MNTNEPMPQERLDAIQERVDAATKGRWDYAITGKLAAWDGNRAAPVIDFGKIYPEDAVFIAHARQDVPALLAEVERLRALTTVTDDMVERAARSMSAHWHDWHTNEALGRQRALARVALDAALGTGEDS